MFEAIIEPHPGKTVLNRILHYDSESLPQILYNKCTQTYISSKTQPDQSKNPQALYKQALAGDHFFGRESKAREINV